MSWRTRGSCPASQCSNSRVAWKMSMFPRSHRPACAARGTTGARRAKLDAGSDTLVSDVGMLDAARQTGQTSFVDREARGEFCHLLSHALLGCRIAHVP